MNFREFLSACGKNKIVELVSNKPQKLSDTEHLLILDEFTKYLYVGGLPEAVKVFSETGSLKRASDVQKELAKLYQADFAKYRGKASLECLIQVFNAVPSTLTKPLKYSQLSQDFSIPTIKNAINLLTQAKVITKVPHTNAQGLPLGGTASAKFFKLILVDIGLLNGLSNFVSDKMISQNQIIDAYRGSLAEQVVGQGLLEQTDGDLYTWYRPKSGSDAEVDYLVQHNNKIIPIEVKSGPAGKLRSMHLFLKEHPFIERGYVFSTAHFEELSS